MTSAPPSPPARFDGDFLTGMQARRSAGEASGPFRILPLAVARPKHAQDVARLCRWASAEGFTLVPRGAGTGMPGGNVGPGVVLDLTAMDRIEPVDPARRTLKVGPGAVAGRVAAMAGRAGLRFPPLPSSADRCTLGGMVANNAAGARSFRHGAVRDWVEALEVVTADGESWSLGPDVALPPPLEALHRALSDPPGLLDRWPAVRKNSSGYALDRFIPQRSGVQLLVGSEGTLGVVTSMTLSLTGTPPSRGIVLLGLPDLETLPRLAEEARHLGASACEYFGRRILEMARLAEDPEFGGVAGAAEALLLVEVEGPQDVVDARMERLRALASDAATGHLEARSADARNRLWEVRHRSSPTIARAAERGLRSVQFIEDCVVPVSAVPAFVRGLGTILEGHGTDAVIFGHAGDGNLHVNPLVDVAHPRWHDRVRAILDETATLVSTLGGTLSGEHGDGRVRAPLLDRIWSGSLAQAFRRVKDGVDPRGVLNPGVILPLPGQDPLEGMLPDAALR